MREFLTQYACGRALTNKAQDEANFGLMAYTNSVRNSIFGIQNIYATKRRELSSLSNSFKPNHKLDVLYENTLHLMQTDLTSIAPELSSRLPFDLEYEQRKIIINDIEDFLK